METIREYCPALKIAIVRSDSYGKSFSHIAALRAELLSDFQTLDDGEITVVYYAGRTHARTYGVEAHVSGAPKSYKRIANTEYVF